MVLCPTIEHNKTYKQCPWLWTNPEVYVLDPGERLHDYLRAFYLVFKGDPTLFIIDDCSATKALTKKKDMLPELAFCPPRRHKRLGPHPEIQLSPEGLARADVAAASREKTRQASVENRSACCLYSCVAMLPVTEGLLVAVLGTHLVLLVFVAWQIAQCLRRVHIRRARRLVIGEMDCDELIDELMSVADPQGAGAGLAEGAPPAAAPAATPDAQLEEERVRKHHERLAAIAAGGQARQYGLVVRGKIFTADQIDTLDNTEIEKMYARYEARLGAAMTLGSAALQLYAGVAAMFFPIENQPGLIADLEGDPFVEHALSNATCELYHRYGMFLAPLTAALTTLKHCQFRHCCPVRVHDGRDDVEKQQGDGGGASTESSSGKSYGES